jgi:hypothetical protein
VAVATAPTLLVPDERIWVLAGVDPRDLTTNPVSAADEAALLVTPPRLPAELGEALRAAWRRVGPPGRLVTADGPGLGGARSTELLEEPAEAEHHHGGDHGHAHHDGHGGMSHDEMMEVRGDPSADGLVMEDIDTVVGPIFAGLPAGLALTATLDGDVACALSPRTTPVAGLDPSAPITSRVAREQRRGWPALAAVEAERALSHLAWMAAFAARLGWDAIADEAYDALAPLVGLPEAVLERGVEPSSPDAVADLAARVEGARTLRSRLAGRGVLEAPGLGGIAARAGGAAVDARAGSVWYEPLGFRVLRRAEGDALARTVLRVREAEVALRLAHAALARDGPGPHAPLPVEGPRGEVGATGWPVRDRELLHAASAAAAGREWAAALATVWSFDPPAWEPAA